MVITRRDILRAIRVEKLKGTKFIHGRPNESGVYIPTGFDHACKVCAVGAVLRRAGVPNYDINAVGFAITKAGVSAYDNEHDAIASQAWFSALSVKFEKLYKSYGGGKTTKTKLASFVKKYFPKEVVIEVQL